MLRTDLPDHRGSTEASVLIALRDQDPLALAEAYHRTVPAAHACARRMLSSATDVEALLRVVYGQLWTQPPARGPLEAWVRDRAFTIAGEELRERHAAPASPTTAGLLPDLPAPEVRYLDAAERALAELDPADREALLLAHDRGQPSSEQEGPDAAAAIERALLGLAGPETSTTDQAAMEEDPSTDVEQMGDWVLGLVDADTAAAIEAQVSSRPGCAARARALRRGRRRLEGLPPTPDMGQRVLVAILAASPPRKPAPSVASALDTRQPEPAAPAPPPPGVAPPAGQAAAAEAAPGRSIWEPERDAMATGEPPAPVADHEVDTGELMAPAGTTGAAVATGALSEPTARPDPYAALDELDEQRPDGGDVDAGATEALDRGALDRGALDPEALDEEDEDVEGADEDAYIDEELVPRSSIGRRILVTLGWLVPIALGSLLGLLLASVLVNR